MVTMSKRDLIKAGIDPHQYEMQGGGQGVARQYAEDCQPSKEHLLNEELLLRNPKEVKRRLENDEPIPDWALHAYHNMIGRPEYEKKVAHQEQVIESITSDRLPLPRYSYEKLNSFPANELAAICRIYGEDIDSDSVLPSAMVELIIRKQDQQFNEASVEEVPSEVDNLVDIDKAEGKKKKADLKADLETEAGIQARLIEATGGGTVPAEVKAQAEAEKANARKTDS